MLRWAVPLALALVVLGCGEAAPRTVASEAPASESAPRPDAPGPSQSGREVGNSAEGWRITVHPGFRVPAVTKRDRASFLTLQIEKHTDRCGARLTLYAMPRHRQIIEGIEAPDRDLQRWMTRDWWEGIHKNHPRGEIATYVWPERFPGQRFVTLPALTDPTLRRTLYLDIPPWHERPRAQAMIHALGIAERIAQPTVGGHGVEEGWRGVLQGTTPRIGITTSARYAWRTRTHTFHLFVQFSGEPRGRWSGAMRAMLHSLRLEAPAPR